MGVPVCGCNAQTKPSSVTALAYSFIDSIRFFLCSLSSSPLLLMLDGQYATNVPPAFLSNLVHFTNFSNSSFLFEGSKTSVIQKADFIGNPFCSINLSIPPLFSSQ